MTQATQPKISVVIRTIGHTSLPRAIDAARSQTWPNLEIVLVKANPDVDTQAWPADGRIVLVSTGAALDRPRAANAGLEAATGDWLLFLDEDDWIDPTHLESLYSAVAPTGLLLAYSDQQVHQQDAPFQRSVGYWRQAFTDKPVFAIHSALFSRQLLDLGCRFDEAFSLLEDWDFFVQCAEHTDFLHVPVASAHYDPYSGTSGGGMGVNRDEQRFKPYLDALTAKWGQRYAGITAQAEAALQQADEAIGRQDFLTARQAVQAGLAVDPGNPLLLNRLAACERVTGDLTAMVMALRRACDSDPDGFRIHLELAAIEHRLGFADRARQLAARLAQIASTDDDWRRLMGLQEYLSQPRTAAR